jgi:hypothetical protein
VLAGFVLVFVVFFIVVIFIAEGTAAVSGGVFLPTVVAVDQSMFGAGRVSSYHRHPPPFSDLILHIFSLLVNGKKLSFRENLCKQDNSCFEEFITKNFVSYENLRTIR